MELATVLVLGEAFADIMGGRCLLACILLSC